MLYEFNGNGYILYGKLTVVDEDGHEIKDEDVVRAAKLTYNLAGDLINELLIPGLNDILYQGAETPLGEGGQDIYENHGCDMMRAAYKVAAYSGAGKVKGQDLVVYPVDPVDYRSDYGIGEFRMTVKLLKL